tara:strand:- start:929 stop:1777 length:849 start_codon:yes stop_codon:yes gene_type:complete
MSAAKKKVEKKPEPEVIEAEVVEVVPEVVEPEPELSLHDKLVRVQCDLLAKKGQKNTFGNYSYRSCEDILQALKPLQNKYNFTVDLNDRIEFIGDRYYVKAEATFTCNGDSFETHAYAREPEIKKGMDSAQITGATSSYARKYALNGLFAIDDCKDADTNEARRQGQAETKPEVAKPKPVAKKQAPKEVQPADIDPETGEAYTDTYTENHVDMFNTVADFCNEHCTKHHMKPGDLKNWIKGQYNGRSLGDMKGDDALLLEVMSRIQKECSSTLRNEPVQDGF